MNALSRITVTPKDRPELLIAVGKDHFFGYFAQVWTNQEHTDCDCSQCEFDQPREEADHLDGWRGAIHFVREKTGVDITRDIVGA